MSAQEPAGVFYLALCPVCLLGYSNASEVDALDRVVDHLILEHIQVVTNEDGPGVQLDQGTDGDVAWAVLHG